MSNDTKHTNEPWQIGNCEYTDTWLVYSDVDGYGEICTGINTEDDARRIVACVNACAGISDENMSAMQTASHSIDAWAEMQQRISTLEAQLAEANLKLSGKSQFYCECGGVNPLAEKYEAAVAAVVELYARCEQLEAQLADEKAATEIRVKQSTLLAAQLSDKEQQNRDLEAQNKELREAYDAACAFIDCHVADPDITDEMCRTYATYLDKRKALSGGG